MDQLVRPPARRVGDPGSNPGSGENFSLKLLKPKFYLDPYDFVHNLKLCVPKKFKKSIRLSHFRPVTLMIRVIVFHFNGRMEQIGWSLSVTASNE